IVYEPWDALEAPRFTGPRTYARLPHVTELDGVDAAVFGIPWDGGASFRGGARFGPEGVRSASGTIPIAIGGDHSATLAELRALAAAHGPLGLIHLDSHSDLWDTYFDGIRYSHGTMFRRAIEEGVVDPSRMLQAGMRGPLYGESDEAIPGELGVESIPWVELARIAPERFAERARERLGDSPAFLSLDVDFVDAAFCPGTGTPEVGGPSSFEALNYLRALTGLAFVGYDVVEVAPAYDGPGQITALFAANAVFEMLSQI